MWPFRCPYKLSRKEILLDAADLDQKGNLYGNNMEMFKCTKWAEFHNCREG